MAAADAIVVEGLSKQYRLGLGSGDTMLRERLVRLWRRPFKNGAGGETIWALDDLSLRIAEGEVVGIIGRNGAGKSTLLKILSRITYPTAGTVTVRGRVASLLEVGTGFHEELTGRENIFLNGSILGMTRREVEAKLGAIVEFAGVERFLDTPIKRYSSGMRLRLGFAVAAHLDPDVLIVDEVLAVGDVGFQKKCLNAMEGLRGGGRTVLFVSHNMAAVENLCSRAVWIDGGKIRMDGPSQPVIQAYMSSFGGEQSAGAELGSVEGRLGSGEIRYTRLEYLTPDGRPCDVVRSGDALVLRFHYRASQTMRDPSFGFRLYTELGTLVTETSPALHGIHIPEIGPGEGWIDLEIDSLNLLPARYYFSLWLTGRGGKPVYDGDVRVALEIGVADVYGAGRELDGRLGVVYFPQRWRVAGR